MTLQHPSQCGWHSNRRVQSDELKDVEKPRQSLAASTQPERPLCPTKATEYLGLATSTLAKLFM
jgi:hypothetical protein